jgi:predicted metalloprotease
VFAAFGLLVVAGCGVDVGVAEVKRGETDVVIGGGGVTTTGSTTPPTTAPPPDIKIQGDDGGKVNRIAANAIVDIQTWWTKQYPEVYGSPYEAVDGGFFAIDRNTSVVGLPCNPPDISVVMNNAFYCPPDDAIAWDQENLLPDLAAQFGDFTVAVVLAHEWGHAIQARADFDQPTVVMELQADCFAGAWSKHITTDKDARFQVTVAQLDQALAGFLSLRDAPGTVSTDPNAHGSGFDRVGAFQEGFEKGAKRCREFKPGDPQPFQFPFSVDDVHTGGELPLTGDQNINDLSFLSLDL